MSSLNSDFFGKKILVVEDNDTSSVYFGAAIRRMNATFISAKNGKEAVEIFKEDNQIDLVLMDLNMPEMDGFEATKIMKLLRPEVPIIAQSAYVLSGEETRSIDAGCNEFLAKPVRLSLLAEALHRNLYQV